MMIDPVKHIAEKAQAACVVVVLYGNVWVCDGHAGLGAELGWLDGYSLLSGCVRDWHVSIPHDSFHGCLLINAAVGFQDVCIPEPGSTSYYVFV